MSYELLLTPKEAERRPWKLFFLAILISTIAIVISYSAFPSHASVLLITFTIIPLIPIIVRVIEDEEYLFALKKFKHHKIIYVYTFLFLGMVFSFSVWYYFMPEQQSDIIFSEQKITLYDFPAGLAVYQDRYIGSCDLPILQELIQREVEITNCNYVDHEADGYREILIYKNYEDEPSFVLHTKTSKLESYKAYVSKIIIKNNLKVLLLTFLTSLIFGAGALYLLTWNASIISVFIGDVAESVQNAMAIGKLSSFAIALPKSIMALVVHGVPEFLAYFVAAVAGGIISVSVLRHKPFSKEFNTIVLDALGLIGISVALIFVAGIIEAI